MRVVDVRHYWVVLGGGEVREAKGVPEDYVCVGDGRVGVGRDPVGEVGVGGVCGEFARGLGAVKGSASVASLLMPKKLGDRKRIRGVRNSHVAAGRVDLIVVVCEQAIKSVHYGFSHALQFPGARTAGDAQSVPRKPGALPHQAPLLGQQPRHLSAHQAVPRRHAAEPVLPVLVDHGPRPARAAVVVGDPLRRRLESRLLREEGVAKGVLGAADGRGRRHSVALDDGVCVAVDARVHAQAEEVLVVVRVDARVHLRAPAVGALTGIVVGGVGVQDAGELDLEGERAVHVQIPVDAVLIVCRGEDVGDDELAGARGGAAVVAEVTVLVQYAGVLLVDADSVGNGGGGAGSSHVGEIEVVDCAFAVAAEREGVGHVAAEGPVMVSASALVWSIIDGNSPPIFA